MSTPLGLFIRWPGCAIESERAARALNLALERQTAGMPDSMLVGVLIDATAEAVPPIALGMVLTAVKQRFRGEPACAFTLETRPDPAAPAAWADAGINRLALRLGRCDGRADEALAQAVSRFPDVAVDLAYGWPGHEPAAWHRTLARVASTGVHHVSLEEDAAGDDAAADLYFLACEALEQAGLPRYETVNFAKPGRISRLNEHVWLGGAYLGLGPGAVGRLDEGGARIATTGLETDAAWLAAVEAGGDGLAERAPLDNRRRRDELFVAALRRRAGLPHAVAMAVLGRPIDDLVPRPALETLVEDGFLVLDADGLRATEQGAPLLDAVLVRLLPD